MTTLVAGSARGNRRRGARRIGALATAMALGVGLLGLSPTTAVAGVPQGAVVSTNPSDVTPNVADGAVYAFAQVGGTMFAGGDFTKVTSASGGATLTRRGLVAFSATTGAILPLTANVAGTVQALTTDGASLFVTGAFTTIGGVARPNVAKINPATGAVDTGFNAKTTKRVADARVVNGRLIIGGEFPGGLRALSLSTGADTGYLTTTMGSTLGSAAGALGVSHLATDPAGTRLVAVGNFTTVNGAKHIRAVMVDLGTTTTTIDPWYYAGLEKDCELFFVPNYLRGVDFSPDGRYFVLIGTGRNVLPGDLGVTICDAAARFETAVATPTRPTWINYSGGDTLLSIAITDKAVYVQGHMRYMNNEGGSDQGGPAPQAVRRQGIAALDPAGGRALSWNPGKDRGVGGKALVTTPAGLWVGSDTTHIAGEVHARVAFLPVP